MISLTDENSAKDALSSASGEMQTGRRSSYSGGFRAGNIVIDTHDSDESNADAVHVDDQAASQRYSGRRTPRRYSGVGKNRCAEPVGIHNIICVFTQIRINVSELEIHILKSQVVILQRPNSPILN